MRFLFPNTALYSVRVAAFHSMHRSCAPSLFPANDRIKAKRSAEPRSRPLIRSAPTTILAAPMPLIRLVTAIAAPRERVFDLARSIDAHRHSAGRTRERAVAGVTTGLIGLGDQVTWEARHFGLTQKLTVRITQFERPNHFQDTMLAGAFKRMVHDHEFIDQPPGTRMIDRFEFQSPFGGLGLFVDRLILTPYLRRFLLRRNAALKTLAESEAWKKFL
jgi:ligand-binding SRPBCC domain-containing protein